MATPGLAPKVHPIQESPAPAVPQSFEETGVGISTLEQLIFKFLYFRGELSGCDLAGVLGLKFSIIDHTLESLKHQHLVTVTRSSGLGNVSAQLSLSEAGRNRARECLDFNQYLGPLPVPLDQYSDFVRRQRPRDGWLTPGVLAGAYRGMVIGPRVLALLGPAVNAGTSFLVYGMPGDGKSYMAENLANVYSSSVYIPNSIECQGNIVQVFDPIYHLRLEEPAAEGAVASDQVADARWVKCRRPFIATGGELTLDRLDLSYNPVSALYDAPYQLKANNGIYLIDDFGRQRATPAEILNRWIVPMERRLDYLSFRSGGKMTVPFECFLVFSTNLHPQKLGDEAFLRRIQYKLHLHGPSEPEFVEIFRRFCASKGLHCPDALIDRFLSRHYRSTNRPMRRCHPRDVISHAIDMMHFEKLPLALTEELLEQAFHTCFLDESASEAAAAEPWAALAPASAPAVSPAGAVGGEAPARPPKSGTLATMPGIWKQSATQTHSVFGRLLYYASLRDARTGRYAESGLVGEAGAAEADGILKVNHARAFAEWLGCTLGHQKAELLRYLGSLGDAKRVAVTAWLRARAYADLLPAPINEQDRRLFLADMDNLVHMLELDKDAT